MIAQFHIHFEGCKVGKKLSRAQGLCRRIRRSWDKPGKEFLEGARSIRRMALSIMALPMFTLVSREKEKNGGHVNFSLLMIYHV